MYRFPRHFLLYLPFLALLFLLLGSIKSVISVSMNHYIQHGLYRLALLDLRQNLNTYLILFFVGSAGVGIAWWVAAQFFRLLPQGWRSRLTPTSGASRFALLRASLICASLGVILAPLIYEYPSIDLYLKSSDFVRLHLRDVTVVRAMFDSPVRRVSIFVTGCLLLLIALFFWLYRSYRTSAVAVTNASTRAKGRRSAVFFLLPSLVLVLSVNLAALVATAQRRLTGPNIVLISLDTVRADHVGSYGHSRDTTPNLDRLAAMGTRFENAVAQASWTLPSMASLLTALYPWEHGAVHWDRKLPRHVVTLAEILKNNSYRTMAVVTNEFVGRAYGFDQGFDVFDDTYLMGHRGTSSAEITERAIGYLRSVSNEEFFLWVHYFDPHYDYESREEVDFTSGISTSLPANLEIENLREMQDQLRSEDQEFVRRVYDEEVHATDHYIGQLLQALDEHDVAKRTVIVVTADHGEEFWERGRIGHAKYVVPELVKVPLVIYLPEMYGPQGDLVNETVELRSIPRTILGLLDIRVPQLSGQDLLSVARGEEGQAVALTEGTEAWHEGERRVALISGKWKFVLNFSTGEQELYDLDSDRLERVNLAHSESIQVQEVVQKLRTEIESLAAAPEQGPTKVRADRQLEERLRALGYLQ